MKTRTLVRNARFLLHFTYLFFKLIVWKVPLDVLSFSGPSNKRKLKDYVMYDRTSMFQKTVIWSAYRLFKNSRMKAIHIKNIDLILIFAALCFRFFKVC